MDLQTQLGKGLLVVLTNHDSGNAWGQRLLHSSANFIKHWIMLEVMNYSSLK